MTQTLMADSVMPITQIPAQYRADRNRGVALYGNGRYACPPDIASAFDRKLFISTVQDAGAAEKCRALDVERFDADAQHWPNFRALRDRICRETDSEQWPLVYCSIDPDPSHGVNAVLAACADQRQQPPDHWWVAWYTNGGFMPTKYQVAAEIFTVCGARIPPDDIWGCQYADMGTYDKSIVYQPANW